MVRAEGKAGGSDDSPLKSAKQDYTDLLNRARILVAGSNLKARGRSASGLLEAVQGFRRI